MKEIQQTLPLVAHENMFTECNSTKLSTRCNAFFEKYHGKLNDACLIGKIEKVKKWRSWHYILFKKHDNVAKNTLEIANNSKIIILTE